MPGINLRPDRSLPLVDVCVIAECALAYGARSPSPTRSYLPDPGVWRDGDANDSSSVVNDEAINGDYIARRAL